MRFKFLPAILILVLGLVGSVVLYEWLTLQAELNRNQRFQSLVQQHSQTLQRELDQFRTQAETLLTLPGGEKQFQQLGTLANSAGVAWGYAEVWPAGSVAANVKARQRVQPEWDLQPQPAADAPAMPLLLAWGGADLIGHDLLSGLAPTQLRLPLDKTYWFGPSEQDPAWRKSGFWLVGPFGEGVLFGLLGQGHWLVNHAATVTLNRNQVQVSWSDEGPLADAPWGAPPLVAQGQLRWPGGKADLYYRTAPLSPVQPVWLPLLVAGLGFLLSLLAAGALFRFAKATLALEADIAERERLIQLYQESLKLGFEAAKLEDILLGALEKISTYAGWAVGHVFLPSEDGQSSKADLWHFQDPNRHKKFREHFETKNFMTGHTLIDRVLAHHDFVWIPDITQDSNFTKSKINLDLGIRTAVGVPIWVAGEIVMVMEFYGEQARECDEALMLRITRLSHNLSALAESHWAQSRIDAAVGRAKGALDHIAQSVFLLDQAGRVMMMNYAAETNFHYKFSDIRGMGFEIFLAEPHQSKYKYFFENYRTNPATATFDGSKEVIGKRKDGGSLQMKLLLQELRLPSGTNLLAVITHQEKDRVLSAAEKLELPKPPDEGVGAMALEPKKAIAGNHVTTLGPLQRIREVIGDLEQKSRAKGTLDGLREIDIQSKAVEDTLSALFTLSRLQDGSLKLEKQNFDLEGLINHAITVMAPRAYLKGLELVCFLQPDVPTKLIGDPDRLEMLLRLMLDNAIRYTSQGQVYLEVKCQQSDLYQAQLAFVVRDSGQGMPSSQTTHLMLQLRQDERTIKREDKRLGLTLRFAKEMARLMEGQISLTSQQGEWTVLGFSAALGRQQVEMNHIGLERNLNGISLLVLDQDEFQGKTLQRKLAYRGAQVDVVRSQDEALRSLQRSYDKWQAYQLVLVTLQDGVSLAAMANALEPQGEKRPPLLALVKPHQEVECPANFPAERFFTMTLPLQTQEPFRRILGILEQGLGQGGDQ